MTVGGTASLTLPDPAATTALGRRLATQLAVGDMIALAGALGSGKSSLARAAIQTLCGEDTEVPSPTFTLVQPYSPPSGPPLYHIDLYRLASPDELLALGWDEMLAEGACLVEWPENAGALLPAERLDIALAATDEGESRTAVLTASPRWHKRLAAILAAGLPKA